ncbi:MAG: hypothetical protein A3G58_02385 [Candidatus Colwellbacteria bacterium RIFCSPLOWO2_12_FULL_46_17]|uniref:FAD-binding PCMH-type domain-containing protein n=2 Tax=Parcubacteria group TaxID=1794811 RepID=A0A1G1ZDS0_9BACT|nr:putative FAD-binding protein [uncultured Parcubacteria bacterium Rifle_16ft_4_minimus_37647]OGY62752.1 MAG: hypothetical protein A3G58_02385 [Candidatus Colwellbacteria bacterium RIFCSPLOWO2_12_FULL_46_17]
MKRSLVNDIHSQLNPTEVKEIFSARSVEQIQELVKKPRDIDESLCIAGGRHSMGGQQFIENGILIDMSKMDKVTNFDSEQGLIEIEAGIQWPKLVEYYLNLQKGNNKQWGIAQKQTGADRFSIGGTISSNSHGRGLAMKPIVDNIETLTIINNQGELVRCSRNENSDLFKLVIGGYGLFGIIVSATLRLVPRRKIQRTVEVIGIETLIDLFKKRISEGFLYGDFQFSIDEKNDDFMHKGVLSTYKPIDSDIAMAKNKKKLSKRDWNNLLLLAHTDKTRAFEIYSNYYLSTSGQMYWSDTHQLSSYIDNYHSFIDKKSKAKKKSNEIITEIYIPRSFLLPFINKARDYFRENKINLIYGTIRLIEEDTESFLPWARGSWVCIVFNLHTEHTKEGIENSTKAFRHLIDLSIEFDGSYSLTYHKFATKRQVEACYPKFKEFLVLKRQYDPKEIFQSDWYKHYKALFSA